MTDMHTNPTPYPDVNKILDLLLTRVQEILGDQLIGMYLDGSLANGGFDDHSDIDVIVATAGDISEQTFSSFKEMHEQIMQVDSPWAVELEVSYIPQDALRRFDPNNNLHPNLERGASERLKWIHHESDWVIQRHILHERGIIVMGPDPRTLIDPVSPDDLRRAVSDGLPIWVNPLLADPSELHKRGFQSFFVLSLCRMLYTLKHGEILPKSAAAEWGKQHLDPRWHPLIERALVGRQHPSLEADPEDLRATLDMMRYVLGQVRPTSYPEVNEVLNLLLSNAEEILGDQFLGMYLYGSLSGGDFNLESSDIDFLIVTTKELSDKTISALEAMHNQIWGTGLKWAAKLEGAYVPKELIRCHDLNGAPCPTVNEGRFYVAGLGSDWIIQRQIVREQGVVLAGPDPKTLIDPVSADEIRESVLGVLREWWFPMLASPTWLREHGSEYHAFAVITMCRALHALEHGTVVSKPKAIQWAKKELGDPWIQLIDKAVRAANHEKQDDFLDETLNFIRFTREQTENLAQKDHEQ
jgi:predicted nucleotidyltransferase